MGNIDYQEKQQKNHINGFLKVVDQKFLTYLELVKHNTMLSTEALYDLWWSVKYICENDFQGDIIECGVWKGGALELAGYALNEFKGKNRIFGFDTFEGHPMPGVFEMDVWGNNMHDKFHEFKNNGDKWAYADHSVVNKNITNIYPNAQIIKVQIDENMSTTDISKISILRLDMDWYAPTKVALEKFYNKIHKGGILIIDDYGHHNGAKRAVDEFISENKIKINFRHINYSCIVANII